MESKNRVREALGRIYEHQPPYFREYFRRYQEDPTSRVFAPLSEAYRKLGRVDEAIEICLDGLKHHPDFHGGRVALAKCYLDKARYAEARVELERVVQGAPENLLAQRLLGDTYVNLGESKNALHAYKMALLLAPNDVTLAELVHGLETQSHEEATERKVIETAPEDDIAPLWHTQREEAAQEETPEPEVTTTPEGDIPALWMNDTAPLPPPEEEKMEIADEPFSVQHVSQIFEKGESSQTEITTETLGDLYFSQGQYDKALRIFEKLKTHEPSIELDKKIQMCRGRLGVEPDQLVRQQKIEMLRRVLGKAQLEKIRQAKQARKDSLENSKNL